MRNWLIFFISLFTIYGSEGIFLQTVNDNDLLQYIKTERYVIALFTKKNCEACDNYENELTILRNDLDDTITNLVVKVIDSQLLKLYSPSKEPALVYFRNGIPLIYDGPLNDEEILNTFRANKEPIVKELTDDNFEHLTQVSTGATTGDWFVMFYSNDCVDCQRMGARWETVGAKLKQRVNVARVNKYKSPSKISSTARRFHIADVPEFILFKQGKMYRYKIPKYDVSAFVSFAKDWWKNAHGEKVPLPESPFDDLTQMCANFLRENPWVMKLGSITFGVIVIVSIASKLRNKTEAPIKKD